MTEFAAAHALYRDTIRPVHTGLMAEFGVPDTLEAACLSVAISWQESNASARDQGDPAIIGPATGKWQFERMGGVWEILNDGKTKTIAHELCRRVRVDPQPEPVWRLFATEAGDELACAFARLLIWKDPANPPPRVSSSEQAAYDYYNRRWKPGAKRREAWSKSWRCGLEVVGEGTGAASAPGPGVFQTGAVAPPTVPASDGRLESLERQVAEMAARLERIAAAWR